MKAQGFTSIPLIQRRARIESKPQTTMWNATNIHVDMPQCCSNNTDTDCHSDNKLN